MPYKIILHVIMLFIIMVWLINISLFIFSYAIGSILPAILISKYYFVKDVRLYFSKNPGMTNFYRVINFSGSLLVLLIDILKIVVTVLFAQLIYWIFNKYAFDWADKILVYTNGAVAMIAHCYPVYFKFKGGKAIASSLGLLILLNPVFFVIAIFVFTIVALTSKIISLASIITTSIIIIISIIWDVLCFCNIITTTMQKINLYLLSTAQIEQKQKFFNTILACFLGAIILSKHYPNIIRIFKNTESKISFTK